MDHKIIKMLMMELFRSWQIISDIEMKHINTYGPKDFETSWPGDFGILKVVQQVTGGRNYIYYTFELKDTGWTLSFFECFEPARLIQGVSREYSKLPS